MKAAQYDHVVLTDADCYPVSDRWLQLMASHLTGEIQFVLGYGGYEQRKGLLNLIIRYETVFTAIQYFSHAILGNPYMGVGRNLAYEKSLFADHYHLASGDDDLFVNRHASGKNTAILTERAGHTLSVPEIKFRSWIKQKQRHLAAGNHYSGKTKVKLALDYFTRMMLYATFVILIVISPWRYIILGLFGIWLVTRLTIFKLGMRSLDEKYLLLPSLLLDPILPLILGIIWLSGVFVTKYQPWN